MQINNKNILLRCDFNEPVKDSELLSTKRIDANLSTIHELLTKKNKLILISHHSDKGQTLLPVYNYIKKILLDTNPKINFVYINSIDEKVVSEYFLQNKNNLPEIILLENTRLFFAENGGSLPRGESADSVATKNLDESNNPNFAKFLSSFADYFVYDAFSVAHRDHSSTTGVAKLLPSCFGLTFVKEYTNLRKLLDEADKTLIFMGGAKLSTKLPIVEKFLDKGSIVCLGGAMVHDILKHRGMNIGNSYLEESFSLDTETLNRLNVKIETNRLIVPKSFVWEGDTVGTRILDNFFNLETIKEKMLENSIKNILWNGPVGMYENGDVSGSINIYNFIKDINKKQSSNDVVQKVFSVVGGGDTLTFLENENKDFEQGFSYVSLSGGAMLTFLADGTLPILEIIETK